MKKTLKFEFDTSNTDDLNKLKALNIMADSLDDPESLKNFAACAQAIKLGRTIQILPAEQPKAGAVNPGVAAKPVAANPEVPAKPVETPPEQPKTE